jgi:hypothetical protein
LVIYGMIVRFDNGHPRLPALIKKYSVANKAPQNEYQKYRPPYIPLFKKIRDYFYFPAHENWK